MKEMVKLAKEKMGITIKESSIEKLHRLGKRKTNKHRDVVVRFRSSTTRNKFYQNRQKTANHSDHHLTEYRRNVFYAVRQLVKKREVFAGWSKQGNILIEGVADKLAKYFSGHLPALWHIFSCNFLGSVHLKLPEKVSRHLVVFSVGRATSKTKIFIENRKINYMYYKILQKK